MNYISTHYKTSIHLDNIKTKIEDIVNIIAKELCFNQYLNVEHIENAIKDKYPDYKNLCTIASKIANTCDSDDQIIFNRNRLQNIMEQMKNNRDFVRMCKFKYGVISGSPLYVNIPLHNVIYSLNNHMYRVIPNINSNMGPIIAPNYFNITPLNMHMFGGNLEVKNNEIGKLIDNDTIINIKLVDFNEFEKEFESKQIDCLQITKAYKMLKRIENSKNDDSIIDVIDEIETLLDMLQYYIVSIDTFKEYVLIKKMR